MSHPPRRALRALSPALLAIAIVSSVHAQRDSGPVAHWVLSRDQLEERGFRPRAGKRWLDPGPAPRFLEGGRGLVLGPGAQALVADPAATPATLPRENLSIEAWVSIDEPAHWGSFLSAIEIDTGLACGWLLGFRGQRFMFCLATEGLAHMPQIESRRAWRRGSWHHVVGTYDGKVQRLYVDGALEAEDAGPEGPIRYHDRHFLVAGAFKDRNEEHVMQGVLLELRLYASVLPEKEIQRRARRRDLPPLPALAREAKLDTPTVAEMQARINSAIDRGADNLLRRQNRDGSWGQYLPGFRNGQTALSTYAALKSGVPVEHPAIQLALDFLARRDPVKTYSAGCQLLALWATKERKHKAWAKRLTDLLLEWEWNGHSGTWGYPDQRPDFSNTQYAAIGLWAAAQMGISIPREVLSRMIEAACEQYCAGIEDVEWNPDAGRRTGLRHIGGFSYRPEREGDGKATGSMTTAGLCILAVADTLGKGRMEGRLRRLSEQNQLRSLGWLDHYFTVTANPLSGGFHYYYLYGLERVGSLLKLERIGGHEWYREGAHFLLEKQKGDGGWGGEDETCFALLFLNRATSPVSGARTHESTIPVFQMDEGPLRFRAVGEQRFSIWITGFADALGERLKEWNGTDPVRVEYRLDDAKIASLDAVKHRPLATQRFAIQHVVQQLGRHRLEARLYLGTGEDAELVQSRAIEILARRSPEEFFAAARALDGENLLDAAPAHASASGEFNPDRSAAKAMDGCEATAWVCATDEREPWIQLVLEQPLRVAAIALAPVDASIVCEGRHDVATRLRVKVNREEAFEVSLGDKDLLMPWVIAFDKPKRVRSLRLQILERRQGGADRGRVGFSEIELRAR